MSPWDRPLPDRFRHRPGVMAREVAGEAVLLDVDSGSYYGLNMTGLRIWTLLGEGRSCIEVVELLTNEYEESPAKIESELRELLGELVREGLLIEED